MVKVIRRWLGVDALERRVAILEGMVEGLTREIHTLREKPVSGGATPPDIRRFRWLHRLNESLRGEEMV